MVNKKQITKPAVVIAKRKTKQEIIREAILRKLKENPLISFVCKKVGVSRSTLYRWTQYDLKFKNEIVEAQAMGRNMLNDVAISKLLMSIDRGDIRAIIFWLKHNHPSFIDPEKALAKELSVTRGKLSLKRKEDIVKKIKMWKLGFHGKK